MNRSVARRPWASLAVSAAALIVVASSVYLLVSDDGHRSPRAATSAWPTPARVHWSSLSYPNRIRTIVLAAGTQPVLETTRPGGGAAELAALPVSMGLTSPGAGYRAVAWVRSTGPPISLILRVQLLRAHRVTGSVQRRVVVAGTTWHEISLQLRPAQPGSLRMVLFTPHLPRAAALLVSHPMVTPTDPPVPVGSMGAGTLFGASVFRHSQESSPEALDREAAGFGSPQILRIYYPGLPAPWPGRVPGWTRALIVSFKALPQIVLSGADDAYLRHWFKTAPAGETIFWSYWHEPEDNIDGGQFTAPQYRAAWAHIAKIAAAVHNPNLHPTLILMAGTARSYAGRNWRDYYPGADIVQVIGWDGYNSPVYRSTYLSMASIFDPAMQVCRQAGKPCGIAEIGTTLAPSDTTGVQRAAWLRAAAGYSEGLGLVFVSYFDATYPFSRPSGGWELDDRPSQRAWRVAIAGDVPPVPPTTTESFW